jgi:hypothetical protein
MNLRSVLALVVGALGVGTTGCSGGGTSTSTTGAAKAAATATVANDRVVASTTSNAPATPFAVTGGALHSDNSVRALSVSGDTVDGHWGSLHGPTTHAGAVVVGGAPVTLPSAWGSDGPAAARTGGGVTERVLPTPLGYTRTWTFQQKPASGPITVSLGIEADAVLSFNASGLHVVRDGGGFKIGSATWIDASGTRSKVPASFAHNQLTFKVSPKLLARSSFPAVLDPSVGAEFLVPPSQPIIGYQFVNDNDDDGAPELVETWTRTGGGLGVIAYPYYYYYYYDDYYSYWGDGPLMELFAESSSSPSGLTLQSAAPYLLPEALATVTDEYNPNYGNCEYAANCPEYSYYVENRSATVATSCGSSGSSTDDCVAWAYLSNQSIVAQRFDITTLTWVDSSPVTITNSFYDSPVTSNGYDTPPVVSFNGTQYLICWLDNGTPGFPLGCSARAAADLSSVATSLKLNVNTSNDGYPFIPQVTPSSSSFAILSTEASDGGLQSTPITVINSTTGTVAGTPVLPANITPQQIGLVGEGTGFLAVGGQAALPAIVDDGGGPADATVMSPTTAWAQRYDNQGNLNGASFNITTTAAPNVELTQVTGQNSGFYYYSGTPTIGGGVISVPARGTVAWQTMSGYPTYTGYTASDGYTYQYFPLAWAGTGGALADGGHIRVDYNATHPLCPGDAGTIIGYNTFYYGTPVYGCYETASGGLAGFVAPYATVNDAGSPISSTYYAQTFELPTGSTAATEHDELAGALPPAAVITDGVVNVNQNALTTSIYSGSTGTYVTGSPIAVYSYGERRAALQGAYDSASGSYFVGWFDEGTQPRDSSTGPLPDAALYVNAFQAPTGSSDGGLISSTPARIQPGAGFAFTALNNDSSQALDFLPNWSMDATQGKALVAYIVTKTSNSALDLVGQRVNYTTGALVDTSPQPLANVTGVTAIRTCHNSTDFFVSFEYTPTTSSNPTWGTVQINPGVSANNLAAGAGSVTLGDVPFANAVGSVMPAFITTTNDAGVSATHVGLVSATSISTVVTDLDVSSSSWNPPAYDYLYSSSSGTYEGYLDVYSGQRPASDGNSYVVVTYYNAGYYYNDAGDYTSEGADAPPVGTYCARINASTGAYIDSHPCSPPAKPSTSYGSWGGAGSPAVGAGVDKLLAINTAANPPTVQRWFVEPWGEGQSPDLPFPTPIRDFSTNDASLALFSWDTTTPAMVVGGATTAMALYWGDWTQPSGLIERDLYARWVFPGFVGTQACAQDSDCDSNECNGGSCVALAAPPPDAGTGESSSSGSSGVSSSGTSSGVSSSGTSSGVSSSGVSSSGTSSGISSSGVSSSGVSSSGVSSSGTSSGVSSSGTSSGVSSGGSGGASSSGTSSGAGSDASIASADASTAVTDGSTVTTGIKDASGDGNSEPVIIPPSPTNSSSGCKCEAAGTHTNTHGGLAWLSLGAVGLAGLRRKRRIEH